MPMSCRASSGSATPMAASCSHCFFLSSTVAFFWGSLLVIVGLSPTPAATEGPAPLDPGTRPLRRATSALACACLRASISWSRWRLLSERRMLPWWRPVASCCCFSNLVSLTKTSQYLHQYFGYGFVSHCDAHHLCETYCRLPVF